MITDLERRWLDYASSVVSDKSHRDECVKNGGIGIEDRSLRWPGYLGEGYRKNGLVVIANIHRDFASGRASADLARDLIRSTRKWRDSPRTFFGDQEYLRINRRCYKQGFKKWTVGGIVRKFIGQVGLSLDDIVYFNAARCQAKKGPCKKLQRLCMDRFPLEGHIAMLRPRLILTCSEVVESMDQDVVEIKWFHQLNHTDRNKDRYDVWAPPMVKRIQKHLVT